MLALEDTLRARGFAVHGSAEHTTEEKYDSEKGSYQEYLNREEWKSAVFEKRELLDECVLIILLLPCGIDSHADWAYAVGKGASSIIVGHPVNGERSPTHLWADALVDTDEEIVPTIELLAKLGRLKLLVDIRT